MCTHIYVLRWLLVCSRLRKVFLPGFLKLYILVIPLQRHKVDGEAISSHSKPQNQFCFSLEIKALYSYSTKKQSGHQKIWAIRNLNCILRFGTGFMLDFIRSLCTSVPHFIPLGQKYGQLTIVKHSNKRHGTITKHY